MAGRDGGDLRAVRGGWVLAGSAALVLAGLATLGCASTSPSASSERVYADPDGRIFELVRIVVHDLGGKVIAEHRATGSVLGRFDADTSGLDFTLDIRLEHEGPDLTVVQATASSELETATRDDLEYWRGRFFEALDALAASAGAGVGRPFGSPSREPR